MDSNQFVADEDDGTFSCRVSGMLIFSYGSWLIVKWLGCWIFHHTRFEFYIVQKKRIWILYNLRMFKLQVGSNLVYRKSCSVLRLDENSPCGESHFGFPSHLRIQFWMSCDLSCLNKQIFNQNWELGQLTECTRAKWN